MVRAILEAVIEPDVSFVRPLLSEVRDRLFGKDLGNSEIAEILNDQFAGADIEFAPGRGSSKDEAEMMVGIVGAAVDPEGDVEIYYLDYFWQTFEEWDEYAWKTFVAVVENLVRHELVHREQLVRQPPEIRGGRHISPLLTGAYLSQPEEVMAFAKSAVGQFREIGYDDEAILRRIRSPFSEIEDAPHRGESTSFWTYTEHFESGDPVLKRFLRYMYDYLQKKEVGGG